MSNLFNYGTHTLDYTVYAATLAYVTEFAANSSFLAYLYGVPTSDIKYVQGGYYSVDTTWYIVNGVADLIGSAMRMLLIVVGINGLYLRS